MGKTGSGRPKKIIILGSTGSIGVQALEVAERYPDEFEVVGLSAGKNRDALLEQGRRFGVGVLALGGGEAGAGTESKLRVIAGPQANEELLRETEADVVVNCLVGSIGLGPTLVALELGVDVALANKETMVAGGELVSEALKSSKGRLIPVDSEHSAIFQALAGEDKAHIRRILITGSGGPFRGKSRQDLARVTLEEALCHPRWRMGPKITVDSATLMNKGLEVIEARWLFDVPYDKIEVVIHPQSIVHSLVEFSDGSVKAQLGPTDMRLPIQYALSWPGRLAELAPSLDLVQVGSLTFEAPDTATFPAFSLALNAGRTAGTMPAVMNAANEEAVAAFLSRRLPFLGIADVIEQVMRAHEVLPATDLAIIQKTETWARRESRRLIEDAEETV